MSTLRCDDSRRREATLAAGLNGIDFLEVISADQRTLEVHFLSELPGQPGGPAGPALGPDNVRIDGGVRTVGIQVDSVVATGGVLTVTVDRAGDFSPYLLRIVAAPGTDQPPAGCDPALAAVEFSFKAACESPFDCAAPAAPTNVHPPSPVIDYLARDFNGFVRLLSDRLSLVSPNWTDRSPADPQMVLVELLADLGDRLSYEQDAVSTEAHLATARSRVSLRRHARLLDYAVDDGATASAWVNVEVTASGGLDGQVLPAGSRLLTGAGGGQAGVLAEDIAPELAAGALVFETDNDVALFRQRNRIRIHTWSDADCTLAAGSTDVWLVRQPGLTLGPGDLVLLEEEISPVTGLAADANPTARHLVHLTYAQGSVDPVTGIPLLHIGWSATEALPFDLRLSSRIDGAAPVDTAVARANLVSVTHGRTVVIEGALSVPSEIDRPFRPLLAFDDLAILANGTAALTLDDGSGLWEWRPAPDLLGASADDPLFVVEFEHGHRPVVRFGDGRNGRRPPPGTQFDLRARLGFGPDGNVGAGAISRLVTSTPGAVRRVCNPLAAAGGRLPQGRDRIVTDAPVAFRTQQRAVSQSDWVEIAQRHPQVQRASALQRWTGSWWTVFIAIDRVGGGSVLGDLALANDLRAYLRQFRMAGIDIELVDPLFVALDLHLAVTVAATHQQSAVARAVHRALSPGPHVDGTLGLFHPDRLSFGEDLWLSRIHEAVGAVPGVRCAEILSCHPLGRAAGDELTTGIVQVGPGEVLRLDDDPNSPEHGRLRIDATGGV